MQKLNSMHKIGHHTRNGRRFAGYAGKPQTAGVIAKLAGILSMKRKTKKGERMDIKERIAERTGIPISLLTGETAEENIVRAKVLLAYKREHTAPQSTGEQFAEWMNAREGIETQDEASQALAELEEAVRVEAGGFPMLKDGGEVTGLSDPRPAREQFAEWMGQKTAVRNPF